MTDQDSRFGELTTLPPDELANYSLPEDALFSRPEMLIRWAVQTSAKPDAESIRVAVKALDAYAYGRGLTRHGELSSESWDWGRKFGVASCFRIVNITEFVRAVERDTRDSVCQSLSSLPWWRRVWLAVSNKWEESV